MVYDLVNQEMNILRSHKEVNPNGSTGPSFISSSTSVIISGVVVVSPSELVGTFPDSS